MTVRINNIRLSIDDDLSKLRKIAADLVGIKANDIENFKIKKESIDARRKGKIDFIYQVEFNFDGEKKAALKISNKDIVFFEEKNSSLIFGDTKLISRPVIIGSGPAGLFAGLVMAKYGYKPILLERGGAVDERSDKIKEFWEKGLLDTDSNIQFGEGGAGTFSDGKLTTRIKDKRCDYVLEEFVKHGAPSEIMYSFKPHIGTDILKNVVKNIRNKIIDLGGEVRFNSKVTDFKIKDGKIISIKVNDDYEIPSDVVIAAIGHSARDTFEVLFDKGVLFTQKPFAIGVRIEHLQSMIDERQYGKFANHPRLRAADYRLTYTSKKYNRPCYSFCMCPGGYVVAASSEKEMVVTNGMSEYKRDSKNANSAIVVGVGPQDFQSNHPLAGIEFQRYYERLAFKAGGYDYMAPVQLIGDFLKDNLSTKIGVVKPSYTRGYRFGKISDVLPDYVAQVLKEGLLDFDKKIKGFADYDAILTGIETRTSSPVRIERDENCECISIKGLYPAGEGAGYAGGIVSSAVDGIKVAENIMKKYAPI
ncbi:hypothetical protein SAMN05443428_10353 [Caloramator quimbayensis]|uniref:FAD-dependent protein C-terminal domain-containing protein n=1 Tax=Caloramator quimbayensis TaxID=1147123 RepID=A0A1T4WS06_9CLOT|nr:hypothetical protein [Caloramator quimbayensis]SKA79401.1 hypothetical protein SAMN05443428_10353 [Caloramator quimbayensis]